MEGINVDVRKSLVDLINCMDKHQEALLKKRFGSRLRSFRESKGLSQGTLGLMSELNRTYIGGVERGERNLSLINIYKISSALGISPRELFD